MNGVSKRIWLLLYCEGGWWTVAEVRRELEVHAKTAKAMHQILGDLKDGGFLESKDEPDYQLERRLRYGVTKRCKVPRGVNLEDLTCAMRMPELKAA